MKQLLKLAALALSLSIFTIACNAIFDMPKVADGFFNHVKNQHFDAAYEMVSKDFQKATSLDQFKQFLISTGLVNFKSSSWTSSKFENSQGEIKGTVETTDGGKIPLTMYFIKESSGWKIQRIEKESAGLSMTSENDGKTVPADDDIKALAIESVYNLSQAINTKDFANFYSYISKLWQQQTDKDKLMSFFQEFIDKKIDISSVKGAEIVISDKPMIDENQLLIFKGYFITKPKNVNFELKYVYEHPDWKLVGISVNL